MFFFKNNKCVCVCVLYFNLTKKKLCVNLNIEHKHILKKLKTNIYTIVSRPHIFYSWYIYIFLSLTHTHGIYIIYSS